MEGPELEEIKFPTDFFLTSFSNSSFSPYPDYKTTILRTTWMPLKRSNIKEIILIAISLYRYKSDAYITLKSSSTFKTLCHKIMLN